MTVTATAIPDVLILEPRVFRDSRGLFFESFNQRQFANLTGCNPVFVQDNQSTSARHVLRGLHYQVHHAQGKLIRAVAGTIFDVAVDLRPDSPTFKQWVGVYLSSDDRRQLWIPEGFGHGFLVMSDGAEVAYKTTDYYSPADERTIVWNDPTLAIDWPLTTPPVISDRDAAGSAFTAAELFPPSAGR